MTKFHDQMVEIFDRYTTEVDPSPVSLDDVAAWAIPKGLWRPAPRAVTKLFKEQLAESLRQQKRVDTKGRVYRAKHSVRTSVGGTQLTLWTDIDREPPRSFMEKSFAQRRKGIANDCFQVKTDVDHYNDEHSGEPPIAMVLDFTDDVAEMEAARRNGKEDDDAA